MSAKLVLTLYGQGGRPDVAVELPPAPDTAKMTMGERASARLPWREKCHILLDALLEHVR